VLIVYFFPAGIVGSLRQHSRAPTLALRGRTPGARPGGQGA